MPRYYCHNCKDTYLKTPTAVVDHTWIGHAVFVETLLQPIMRSEDAHLPPEKTSRHRVDFRCDDCNVLLEGIHSFLRHLDKVHDIHIWYERGLSRKRVYFDGILSTEANDKTKQRKLFPPSKKPYQPRKAEDNE